MKFQVGKLYPFIMVEYQSAQPRFQNWSLYQPWSDALLDLNLILLECQEVCDTQFLGKPYKAEVNPKSKEVIQFPVKELIFFPKNVKKRCTIFQEN